MQQPRGLTSSSIAEALRTTRRTNGASPPRLRHRRYCQRYGIPNDSGRRNESRSADRERHSGRAASYADGRNDIDDWNGIICSKRGPRQCTTEQKDVARSAGCVPYGTDSHTISVHTPGRPRLPLRSSRFREDSLHRASRYVSFLILIAALSACAAPKAGAAQEVVVKVDHARYYDRDHHDYHEWNDREERSYRVYLGERHRDYREFRLTSHGQQADYWNWRHRHPDHH